MTDYTANAICSNTVDSLPGLFEPDVILPSQFNQPDEEGLSGGERKLMAAILSDGIEAYIAQTTAVSRERRRGMLDAAEWVETQDYSYVFSFDNVCECLGINPDYLRIGLARYVDSVKGERKSGTQTVATRVWKKIRRPRKK